MKKNILLGIIIGTVTGGVICGIFVFLAPAIGLGQFQPVTIPCVIIPQIILATLLCAGSDQRQSPDGAFLRFVQGCEKFGTGVDYWAGRIGEDQYWAWANELIAAGHARRLSSGSRAAWELCSTAREIAEAVRAMQRGYMPPITNDDENWDESKLPSLG